MRVSDHPASGHGRTVLVERELELDGHSALQALIADYLDQAAIHNEIPILACPVERYGEDLW